MTQAVLPARSARPACLPACVLILVSFLTHACCTTCVRNALQPSITPITRHPTGRCTSRPLARSDFSFLFTYLRCR